MHPMMLLQGVPLHGGVSAWTTDAMLYIGGAALAVAAIWLAVAGVRYVLWLWREERG